MTGIIYIYIYVYIYIFFIYIYLWGWGERKLELVRDFSACLDQSWVFGRMMLEQHL